MNAIPNEPDINATPASSAWTRLKVLFIYEDAEAEDRALHEAGGFLPQHERLFRAETHRWDFLHPAALANLREAVCMADIIVIAGRADAELPVEMQAAIEVGLDGRRVEGGKLLALLGRVQGKEVPDSPLWLYARELSQRAGLEFVTAKYDAQGRDREDAPETAPSYSFESIHQRAAAMTPTLASILTRPCEGDWRN